MSITSSKTSTVSVAACDAGTMTAISRLLKCAVIRLSFVLAASIIAGCGNLAGPEYQQPTVIEKEGWRLNGDIEASGAIQADWWTGFNDSYLNQLIEQAIANNLDLKLLSARTGLAEASVSQANAARLPTLDVALGQALQKTEGFATSKPYSYASALGWELDIWGKAKKGVAAQKAAVRASEADWRAGYLTLVADLAQAYFQIRQFDDQIAQQQNSLQQAQQILAIYSAQYNEGLASNSQVLQQQAEISRLENDLIELQRLRAVTNNAVATLLGVPAGEMLVPVASLLESVQALEIPAGIPADLLARRPDLLAAEYRVLQAHELVGQARLARLPSFSLTSNFGNTSNAFSNLLQSFTTGITPTFNLPIFDPNVRARLKVNKAQTKVAEAEYRSAVLRAYEEVESALVNISSRNKQRAALVARNDALEVVAKQVQAQLREGIVSQLEVFESERSLLGARLALLQNKQQLLSDTVVLYKALGGGWPTEAVVSQ